MGITVDLIIIAIVALSTLLAYKKGFVKLAIQLCTFIIAIILTLALYKPITSLVINTTNIDEMIENTIYNQANDIMQESDNDLTKQMIETTKNEMLPETARRLSIEIVTFGVIIILWIVIKIALRFIKVIANAIAKLPILNLINRTGGIVYGIIRGILIIYVALIIINIYGQINPNNTVSKSIEESLLGKEMYQNNILNIFLG